MLAICDKLVARLVMEYYDSHGCRRHEFRRNSALEMTDQQRSQILEGMESVNILCGLANLVEASPSACCIDVGKVGGTG